MADDYDKSRGVIVVTAVSAFTATVADYDNGKYSGDAIVETAADVEYDYNTVVTVVSA